MRPGETFEQMRERIRKSILRNLDEARAAEDGVVVFEGDWGGTIYATVPVKYLSETISHQELSQLAVTLEKIHWDCNIDEDSPEGGSRMYYKRAVPGDGILGGMGGGCVMDGLWTHPGLTNNGRRLLESALSETT